MPKQKEFRRIVGYLAARLRQLGLGDIADPRDPKGRRWKLEQIIAACLLGMMAGCRNLLEVERLTAKLSRPTRRLLGIPRRLPDTTARDTLCALSGQELLPVLHRVVALASASGSLKTTLPLRMVAMDGKATALPCWNGPFAQKHQPEDGVPYGLMRTVTSTLVSNESRACIDVSAIPASTNEMGHFPTGFGGTCDRFHQLFDVVSYDQGANSEENALYVLSRDKHYLLRLNDERRHMQQLAMELLDHKDIIAESHDVICNSEEVHRRLRLFRVNTGLVRTQHRSELWPHTKTLLCVESQTRRDGALVRTERRYYATSLEASALSSEQWLALVRMHWRVELTHQTLDIAFKEDERPWITGDANAMLVVLILRRIAYTLLTLYRSVRQRSDEKRQMPWSELFEWVRDALIASTEATLQSLRKRKAFKKLGFAAAA